MVLRFANPNTAHDAVLDEARIAPQLAVQPAGKCFRDDSILVHEAAPIRMARLAVWERLRGGMCAARFLNEQRVARRWGGKTADGAFGSIEVY